MSTERQQRLEDALQVLPTPEAKHIARQLAEQLESWSIFWDDATESVTLEQEKVSITIQ